MEIALLLIRAWITNWNENSNIVKDQAFILNAKGITDEHLNPAPKAVEINATIMKMNTLVIKECTNYMRYMQLINMLTLEKHSTQYIEWRCLQF